MVDQNQEVKRTSNTIIIVRNGMSRKSIGTTRRGNRVKIVRHQVFRGA